MSEKDENTEKEDSNIQTFIRIRPSKNPSGYIAMDSEHPDRLHFLLPDNFKSDYVNNSKLKHSFEFNGVIPMEATQDDVFKLVGMKALKNALDGYNSTIFAYGQTGSGKTFTLTGGPEKYSDRGIIPRTISTLFSEFRKRTDAHFKMYISYLELYNEQGYDLLDSKHDTKTLDDLPKVTMLEDEHGNYHLKNLSLHPAENEEDALNLLFMGDTNRAVAETPMNMASSRSHCIFSISIECRLLSSDKVRRSKLHLVDLAGSERVSKTHATGGVLKEARYINTSLFYLEMVIVALYEKATRGRAHVPYRNSMMTSVLRDSLGGNCKTVMIATINPEMAQTEESISTCRFAQRVSLIKNKAIINEDQDPEVVITRLKGEMLNLREEIQFLKGEAGEGDALTPKELADLKQSVVNYCDNPDPNSTLSLGKMTLTKIRDTFGIFKNLVLEARASAQGKGEREVVVSDSNAQKEIDDLKSLLLQRDNEIAILVNMVKKGKGVNDISGTDGNGDNNDEMAQAQANARNNGMNNNGKSSNSGSNSSNNSVGASTVPQQKSSKEEMIVKRHLFGVPPPPDPKILEDAANSFEYFRERCSLNTSMEENRELLKDKINEAKVLGERANQSRGTINYLKTSIETIRREKALQKMSSKEADAKDGEEEGAGEDESPEEATYRRAIEQEKNVYKESFERLKVLKPEIEHIRKLLENCRLKMQGQFDEWFSNIHSRNLYSETGPSNNSAPSTNTSNNNSNSVNNSYVGSDTRSSQQSFVSGRTSLDNTVVSMSSSDFPTVSSVRKLGGGSSVNTSVNSSIDNSSAMLRSDSKPTGDRRAPAPAKGAVSDDVDDDISAFYQAKEELLKRMSRQPQ